MPPNNTMPTNGAGECKAILTVVPIVLAIAALA
jgi:hypothetical protein